MKIVNGTHMWDFEFPNSRVHMPILKVVIGH